MSRNRALLALGSNVGNWKNNFNRCLKELKKIGNINAIGNIYVSRPYGYINQNNFYNTAIDLHTKYCPPQLLIKLQLIEKLLHKNKIIKNGPRRIDIDIIFFNSLKFNQSDLTIPHPRVLNRDFVLYPLCDIDPFYRHPVEKKTIHQIKVEIQKTYIERKIMQRKDLFVIY